MTTSLTYGLYQPQTNGYRRLGEDLPYSEVVSLDLNLTHLFGLSHGIAVAVDAS